MSFQETMDRDKNLRIIFLVILVWQNNQQADCFHKSNEFEFAEITPSRADIINNTDENSHAFPLKENVIDNEYKNFKTVSTEKAPSEKYELETEGNIKNNGSGYKEISKLDRHSKLSEGRSTIYDGQDTSDLAENVDHLLTLTEKKKSNKNNEHFFQSSAKSTNGIENSSTRAQSTDRIDNSSEKPKSLDGIENSPFRPNSTKTIDNSSAKTELTNETENESSSETFQRKESVKETVDKVESKSSNRYYGKSGKNSKIHSKFGTNDLVQDNKWHFLFHGVNSLFGRLLGDPKKLNDSLSKTNSGPQQKHTKNEQNSDFENGIRQNNSHLEKPKEPTEQLISFGLKNAPEQTTLLSNFSINNVPSSPIEKENEIQLNSNVTKQPSIKDVKFIVVRVINFKLLSSNFSDNIGFKPLTTSPNITKSLPYDEDVMLAEESNLIISGDGEIPMTPKPKPRPTTPKPRLIITLPPTLKPKPTTLRRTTSKPRLITTMPPTPKQTTPRPRVIINMPPTPKPRLAITMPPKPKQTTPRSTPPKPRLIITMPPTPKPTIPTPKLTIPTPEWDFIEEPRPHIEVDCSLVPCIRNMIRYKRSLTIKNNFRANITSLNKTLIAVAETRNIKTPFGITLILERLFRKNGLKTISQKECVTSINSSSNKQNCENITNVIGLMEGTENNKFIVVGALYDVLHLRASEDSDDSRSGLVSLVQIIKTFRKARLRIKPTIIFAVLDNHAKSNGTRYFVEKYLKNKILKHGQQFIGAIILDRIMNYNDDIKSQFINNALRRFSPFATKKVLEMNERGNFIAVIGRRKQDGIFAEKFAKNWNRTSTLLNGGIIVMLASDHVANSRRRNIFKASDIGQFWRGGSRSNTQMRAIFIHDTGRLRKFSTKRSENNSIATKRNLEFLGKVTETVILTLSEFGTTSILNKVDEDEFDFI